MGYLRTVIVLFALNCVVLPLYAADESAITTRSLSAGQVRPARIETPPRTAQVPPPTVPQQGRIPGTTHPGAGDASTSSGSASTRGAGGAGNHAVSTGTANSPAAGASGIRRASASAFNAAQGTNAPGFQGAASTACRGTEARHRTYQSQLRRCRRLFGDTDYFR